MDRSDTVIFACSALEIYVSAAQEKEGTCYPAVFLDKENHMEPKCMRQCILDAEKSLPATVKNVLVAMGFCGGALDSVSFSRRFVIPRVDDCVSFLFGSCRKKLLWNDSYFLTEGWLKGETNIWREYRRSLEKYGEAKTRQIFQVLFAHYRRIALLDTGCYDLDGTLPGAKQIADAFSLDLKVLPVSPDYFRALLTGPWDPARFLVVRPGETVTGADLAVTY